ncbi:unnamed protein product [Allacma fusca]|uniref:Tubby C-terminal domain-containing protein n=1 Tax=Allacma fusca TaxID=39272 RepID=A0A8J2LRX0_9HEXA|nr:unnamed protein product [Allacma fusca]
MERYTTKLLYEDEESKIKSRLRRKASGNFVPEESISISAGNSARSYKPNQGTVASTSAIINVRPVNTDGPRTPRLPQKPGTSAPSPKSVKLKNEVGIDPTPDFKPILTKNRPQTEFYFQNEKLYTPLGLNTESEEVIQSPAKKTISQSTVDGLGFDLETIDLTNDTDRKAHRRNDDDNDEYDNNETEESTSSSSVEDEDERSDSNDGSSYSRTKPARRYISVESLVLEDNFDASNGFKTFNGDEVKGADDEIPQVKLVWNTPPEGSPRGRSSRKGFADLPLPRRTHDPNHDSILDFFTRTEDGVEREGRYDDVEMTISKFFMQSDDNDKEKVTKCVNLKQIVDNIDEFVLQPAAIGFDIQCRVTRDRKGVDRGLYPTYYMHLERPDGRKILLLTGRKRKKSTTSNYLISTDASDLSRDSNHFVGKVRSNLLGTQFTIYDNGQSQKRFGLFQSYGSETPLREELAAVIYEPNVLGFKGPRKMKILIPEMKNESRRREHRPAKEKDSILELHKQGESQQFFELRNKAPIWNDDNQSFVLNFHGRVTQASVKNFQIIHEKKDDYVILQFGRVASDLFTMDYRYPLCALQAFAIVLTSFDNKLACE